MSLDGKAGLKLTIDIQLSDKWEYFGLDDGGNQCVKVYIHHIM